MPKQIQIHANGSCCCGSGAIATHTLQVQVLCENKCERNKSKISKLKCPPPVWFGETISSDTRYHTQAHTQALVCSLERRISADILYCVFIISILLLFGTEFSNFDISCADYWVGITSSSSKILAQWPVTTHANAIWAAMKQNTK